MDIHEVNFIADIAAELKRIADGIEALVAYNDGAWAQMRRLRQADEDLTPEEICWNCGRSFIPIVFASTCGLCTIPETEVDEVTDVDLQDIPF